MTQNHKVSKMKICSKCSFEKDETLFVNKRSNLCKDCNNKRRREEYKNNKGKRLNLIKAASDYKKYRRLYKHVIEEIRVGTNNKECRYCHLIKPRTEFRHNRRKCKRCEYTEPVEKLKRAIKCRIFCKLKRKSKQTIDYLGCTYDEYFKWLKYNNPEFTSENFGDWHIDHVVPLSHFNLDNEEEQHVAFNWRNTSPVIAYFNLAKCNRIDKNQITEHLEKLKTYHKENSIHLDDKFTSLFARCLDAGTSLEPQTTTPNLETEMEELG